jgi:hypothetical protein
MARGVKFSTPYGIEILPVAYATLKLKILSPERERYVIRSEDVSFMHKNQTRRPQGHCPRGGNEIAGFER